MLYPAVIYLFKVNNKDTRRTPLVPSGVFSITLEHISHFVLAYCSVSIVNFEQVNTGWDSSSWKFRALIQSIDFIKFKQKIQVNIN